MKWIKWLIIIVVGTLFFLLQTIVFDAIINVTYSQPIGPWGRFGIRSFTLILTVCEVIGFLKIISKHFPNGD